MKVLILAFVMFRRLSAIMMMLILAGQALAGVCQCIGEGDLHLCCEKSAELTIKRPPCCTEGDCLSSSDVHHSTSGQLNIRISPEDSGLQFEANGLRIPSTEFLADSSTPLLTTWTDPPLEKEKTFLRLQKLII